MQRADEIADKVRKLIEAEYCYDDLAILAEEWLESIDTTLFEEKTKRLIAELKEDIMPIDELIHYCEIYRTDWFSPKEEADDLLKHAQGIKKSGGLYCDCEACTLAQEILMGFEDESEICEG